MFNIIIIEFKNTSLKKFNNYKNYLIIIKKRFNK